MKKYIPYLLLFLFLFPVEIFCQRNIEEYINIIKEIDKLCDGKGSVMLAKIDSTANSYKEFLDFYSERSSFSEKKSYLGNELLLYQHMIKSYLYIDYLEYNTELYKIKYSYYVFKNENFLKDSLQLSQLANSINAEIVFSDYRITLKKTYLDAEQRLKNNSPQLNLSIASSFNTKGIEYINDPINKLTYGVACGDGGDSPDGFMVFASLVHYKEYSTLEKLLYSPNPVSRLYAADGLMYSNRKHQHTLNDSVLFQITQIYSDDIQIHTCSGCSGKDLPIKYAKIEFEEQMENPYENIIFIREK